MQYNILRSGVSRRPPKGEGVFSKPCCLTCVRLRVFDETEDIDLATCAHIGGLAPKHALVWGFDQCHGYEPRPLEDYYTPGGTTKVDGVKVAAPGGFSVQKKARRVTVIIAPSDQAFIVDPRKSSSECDVRRDSCSSSSYKPRLGGAESTNLVNFDS